MKKNSIKNTRINAEVQKELSMLISREIKDPRINQMTSVIAVEVAPDLKTAKIYISVLGDQESKKSTLIGLKNASSFMRGQLAKTLNLRNTPELTFVIDSSIEYGVHMSKLIAEVNKGLEISKNRDASDEDNKGDSDEVDGEDQDEDDDEDDGEDDGEDDEEDDGEDQDDEEDTEDHDDEDPDDEEDNEDHSDKDDE